MAVSDDLWLSFPHVAAKPKKDAPEPRRQEPMRAQIKGPRRNPSSDQKSTRRQLKRRKGAAEPNVIWDAGATSLWHGTGLTSGDEIGIAGFRIPEAILHGWDYGRAVYLSIDESDARHYAHGRVVECRLKPGTRILDMQKLWIEDVIDHSYEQLSGHEMVELAERFHCVGVTDGWMVAVYDPSVIEVVNVHRGAKEQSGAELIKLLLDLYPLATSIPAVDGGFFVTPDGKLIDVEGAHEAAVGMVLEQASMKLMDYYNVWFINQTHCARVRTYRDYGHGPAMVTVIAGHPLTSAQVDVIAASVDSGPRTFVFQLEGNQVKEFKGIVNDYDEARDVLRGRLFDRTAAKTALIAARGFPCELTGPKAVEIYHRMKDGTATAADILYCANQQTGGTVGVQWGLEGSEYGADWADQGAADYAYVDESTSVRVFGAEQLDPANENTPEDIAYTGLGELAVILIGNTEAKYISDEWDASIPPGSVVELTEVRYDAGWGWKKLPAQGLRAVAADESEQSRQSIGTVSPTAVYHGSSDTGDTKVATRFEPGQMASWPQTKPWNLTSTEAEAQLVPGWWGKSARGSESASWEKGYIRPSPEFFSLPEDARRAIAYHEAGHAMIEAAGGLGSIAGAMELIDQPGGQALGYNGEEIIAEAYSVLWTEPEWFERSGAQAIRTAVIEAARRAGYPLPSSARTAAYGQYALSLADRATTLPVERCRKCGANVVWATGKSGKKYPCNTRAKMVYEDGEPAGTDPDKLRFAPWDVHNCDPVAAQEYERIKAERAEIRAAIEPVPTGSRVTISGTVTKVDSKPGFSRDSPDRRVMTVTLAGGGKVWGTIPSGADPAVGDHIEFVADVEGKAGDHTFGFFKRPKLTKGASYAQITPEQFEILDAIYEQTPLTAILPEKACWEVSSEIARQLGWAQRGGYYDWGGPFGPEGHFWNEMPDGTIVDATHDQFDPDVPIAVFEPGSPEHARYETDELHTKLVELGKGKTASLKTDIELLRPQLAHAVQQIIDEWSQDDEGFDEEFGYGGACDAAANAMSAILTDHGIETAQGGADGDDHAWVVALRGEEVVGVDIPPGVYETGGGYSWTKREDVSISPGDVDVWDLDVPAENFRDEYGEHYGAAALNLYRGITLKGPDRGDWGEPASVMNRFAKLMKAGDRQSAAEMLLGLAGRSSWNVEGGKTGVWWTTDLATARSYGGPHSRYPGNAEGTLGLVIHARAASADDTGAGTELGYTSEHPVVLREGAQVQIVGVDIRWNENPRSLTSDGEWVHVPMTKMVTAKLAWKDLAWKTIEIDGQSVELAYNGYRKVEANYLGKLIGIITWWADEHTGVGYEILGIEVDKDWQRKGLATAMLHWAREVSGDDIHHSTALTDDGKEFARNVAKTLDEAIEELADVILDPANRWPPSGGSIWGDKPVRVEPDWADVLKGVKKVYRGYGIKITEDEHQMLYGENLWSQADKAAHVLEMVSRRGGLGMHWTKHRGEAAGFAGFAADKGDLRVIVEALPPRPEDVLVGQALSGHGVQAWDNDYGEQEIPIRPGAPIQVVYVEWAQGGPRSIMRSDDAGGWTGWPVGTTKTAGYEPWRPGIPFVNWKGNTWNGQDHGGAGVVSRERGEIVAYRGFGSWDEAKDALAYGAWRSKGMFTVKGEGETQMALDLSEVLRNRGIHSMRGTGFLGFIEADISGLPFETFISPGEKMELNPVDQTRGTIYPDAGLGIGINGGIPLDRIRRVVEVREDGSWNEMSVQGLRNQISEMKNREGWEPEVRDRPGTHKIVVIWSSKVPFLHKATPNHDGAECGESMGYSTETALVRQGDLFDGGPVKNLWWDQKLPNKKPCPRCFAGLEMVAMAVPNFKGTERNMSERNVIAAANRILADIAREYGYNGPLPAVEITDNAYDLGSAAARSIDITDRNRDLWPHGCILLDRSMVERAVDKEFGYSEFRIVAHEAIHALIQREEPSYPGYSQMITEGGAEVLSVAYWAKNAPAFDDRDAVRLNGKWVPGDTALVHGMNYKDWVRELMARTASKVGWNVPAILAEVKRIIAGNTTVKLDFRDATNPNYAPPSGVENTAEGLMLWLIGQLTDRAPHSIWGG